MRQIMALVLLGFLGSLSACSDSPQMEPLSQDATLSNLVLSAGTLSPLFTPATTMYTARLFPWQNSIQVQASAANSSTTIRVNNTALASGSFSGPVAVTSGVTVIAVAVQAAGGATQSYTVMVMRSQEPSQYLKASNTGFDDQFAGGISLSGDTLAVGAPNEDSSATGVNGNQGDNGAQDSGAVYVFRRTDNTWVQEAYLKASNTEKYDGFGRVSLSGDTLAVGAQYEDSSAPGINGNQSDNGALDSGAVYVFRRTGTTWTQEAYLKASNPGANDIFGGRLSLSGDSLAVSAAYESSSATGVNGDQTDNSAGQSGAIYLFRRTGTTWAQEAYLKASNTTAGDQFGLSVSLSGDTLAVGAPYEASSATGVNGDQINNGAFGSGAVYVFQRNGTTWAQQAYLKASNTDRGDSFGLSLSLSADILAVGAPFEASSATGVNGDQTDNSLPNSGAVYAFRRTANGWVQDGYIKASNTAASDKFGLSLSLLGDTLAVGAQGESSNATGVNGDQTNNSSLSSGAIYVYR